MNDFQLQWNRYATITVLSELSRSGLGRTALMKLCYFLQVLRNVDLAYDFRLYTYGPFDAQVLDDLSYTEFLGAIEESRAYYPGAVGYIIRPNEGANSVKEKTADFLHDNQEHLEWVMREFGNYTAAELELLSTMIYVDREACQDGETLRLQELVRRVLQVKPHFTEDTGLRLAQVLAEKDFLRALRV